MIFPPINLQQWIKQHRHLLKPPVGNKMVFKEQGFIVMIVGGPNQRHDFHYEEGAEFFYQIEGDLQLKVYEEGRINDIWVREGELFLLPPKIPHSPQRMKDTVGLVIERSRLEGEKDGLLWYCEGCSSLLYEEYFMLRNIEQDFQTVFNHFYPNQELRTCKHCHKVNFS